uniref:CTHL2 protein n=1 Tax=Strix occidentalis caurina TaxID=311401 RepID=A0A8D0EXU3_STROC
MLNSWVLVLAVLGGACALPAPAPLAYTQALAQAVDSYNQRPEVQNAFRLLSADPEPAPGVDLSTLRVLNFSVMETECAPSAQVNPDDCDFKENGVIKECSGPVQFLQSSPEIDLTCTDASSNVSGEAPGGGRTHPPGTRWLWMGAPMGGSTQVTSSTGRLPSWGTGAEQSLRSCGERGAERGDTRCG